MTTEEMKAKYPLTPERLKQLKELAKTEPDMTDPDAPDCSELMAAHIKRMGRPRKAAEDRTEQITLRMPHRMLTTLRKTGKGWQTRVVEAIDGLIRKGAL